MDELFQSAHKNITYINLIMDKFFWLAHKKLNITIRRLK